MQELGRCPRARSEYADVRGCGPSRMSTHARPRWRRTCGCWTSSEPSPEIPSDALVAFRDLIGLPCTCAPLVSAAAAASSSLMIARTSVSSRSICLNLRCLFMLCRKTDTSSGSTLVTLYLDSRLPCGESVDACDCRSSDFLAFDGDLILRTARRT
eukprot:2801698-Pleurochrysis_carterae.AAC.3